MRATVHQAKTQLSQILRRVAAGEEVVILHGKRPVAKVIPFPERSIADIEGDLRGKIRIAEDFDELPSGFEDYV